MTSPNIYTLDAGLKLSVQSIQSIVHCKSKNGTILDQKPIIITYYNLQTLTQRKATVIMLTEHETLL